MPQQPDAGARNPPAKPEMSLGASLLESAGGLIMGIGAVVAAAYAWRSFGQEIFWSFALPATLGFGSGTVLLGRMLIVIARSGRQSGHWLLWAQILLHLSAILSFSLPLFIYGLAFFAAQVADLNGTPVPFEIGPIHSWRLSLTVLLGGIPFLLGLAMMVSALVWGHTKRAADIPSVFN